MLLYRLHVHTMYCPYGRKFDFLTSFDINGVHMFETAAWAVNNLLDNPVTDYNRLMVAYGDILQHDVPEHIGYTHLS